MNIFHGLFLIKETHCGFIGKTANHGIEHLSSCKAQDRFSDNNKDLSVQADALYCRICMMTMPGTFCLPRGPSKVNCRAQAGLETCHTSITSQSKTFKGSLLL